MASGPYFDPRRGTWSIQWKDGARWRRVRVVKKKPGWKPSDGKPARAPRAAILALAEYERRELAGGKQGADWETTVTAFLGAWEKRQETMKRRPNTMRALKRAVSDFIEWCNSQGVTLLCEVTPEVCDGFVLHWKASGRGHAYLKQQRGLLSPAWRRAVKKRVLSINPWDATELGDAPPRVKFPSWTPDEFNRLLAVCRPWLADVLVVGCYCGLRITALTNLEPAHVRWIDEPGEDFGEVVVPPGLDKAGSGYEVPIHKELHDVLARRIAAMEPGQKFILVGPTGKPLRSNTTTGTAIQRACKHAGLPVPRSPNHAMRRTFGRWAVLGHLTGEPIDIYKVSKWMGHHSIDMTLRYLDMDRQTSRESMRDKRPEKPADQEPPTG